MFDHDTLDTVALARADFIMKLDAAIKESGGHGLTDSMLKMPLIEVIKLLAQNGLRMTFKKEWHADPSILEKS